MSNQTKGLAALLAAHGRNGDTELVHATKGEIAALNRIKRGVDGRDLPRNPKTGLTEASWFQDAMPYIKAAAPVIAGGAATALTGGAASPLLVGALAGGATGAGIAAAEGKSGDQVLMGGGLGAIGGVGGAGMASGLGVGAGAGAAETTTATTVPNAVAAPNAFAGEGVGLGGANAFSGTPAPLPGSEAAFGSTGTANVTATQASPFQQGLTEGMNAYGGTGTTAESNLANLSGQGQSQAQATLRSMPNLSQNLPQSVPQTTTAQMSPAQGTVEGGKFVPYDKTANAGLNWDYLGTDKAASDTAKIGLGGLGSLALNQDNLTGTGVTGDTVDRTLPETEVYYTDTGERRTRVVDRPRYGNVNMARGGDVYGDYDGVEEAADGGYIPGGGLNYANGGVARFGGGGFMGTGWGEQNRGGFSGLTESLQPGGALGAWHGKLYGALGADQVMPGGAMGSLIPGANQYNTKKREDEERKRREEEEGIAAAVKAKQAADQKAAFESQWSERYGAPVTMAAAGGAMRFAEGGIAQLGQLLSGQNNPNVLGQYAGAKLTGQLGNNAAGTATAPTGPISMPSGFDFEGGTIGDGFTSSNPALRASGGFQPNYAPTTQAPQVQTGASSLLGYNTAGGGQSGGGAQGAFPLEGRYGIIKMAGGGALGHYSDGGQMLRGPGDGVSDSIPASIEGKRPARLADGEFVIPARAVSELGNGSTEAGSKQLYAMLDRIAKKRKKGSGLAYQANPKKLMPV